MPIKSLNHLRPLLRLPSHPAPSPEHFSSNPSLLHHLPSQSGPSTQSLSNSSSFFAPGTSNAGNASGAGAGRSGWGSSTGSSSGSGYTGHARAFLSLPQGDVGNSLTQPGGNSTDNEQKRRLKLEAQQNTLLRHSLSKRVELVNIDEGDLGRRVHRQIEARGSSSIQLVDLEAASSIPSLDVRPNTITYPSTTQTRSVTPLPIRSSNVPPRLRAISRSQSSLEIWQLSTSPLSRSVSLRALSTRSPHQSLPEGEIDETVLDLAGESAGLGLSSVGSLTTPPISARVIGQPNRVLMDLAGLDLPGTQSRPFRTLGQRRNSTAATGQNYNDARAGPSRRRAQATSPEAAAISNAIMSAARDGRVDIARDLIQYYRQDRTPSAFAAPPTSRPDLKLPPGYDTYTYNTCLSALVFFREPGQSIALLLETYNEMLERDCVPNGETFTHIIQGLAQREQDIVKATKTAEKEIKWHEWTMSKVDGDVEMAFTPGDLKKREYRWQEVESYKAEGNYDTLVALLDHVEDLAPTGDLIDYRAINSIARLASERGDIPVMKRIIQLCGAHRIRGQGDRTRYLLTALANAGDAEALRATWLKNKQSDLSSRPNQDEQRAADGSALLARRKLWTDAVIAFFIAKEPEIGYSLVKEMLESKGNSGTVAPSLNRDGIYLLVHYLAEVGYPDFAHDLLVASVPIVGPHTNLYRAYDALGQSYLLQDRVMDAYDFAAKYYFGVKNKDEAFNQISTFCQRLIMAILDKALVEDDPARVEEYLNCVNLLRGSTKEIQSWYPMAKVYVNVCKKHGRLHSSVDAFGYLFASKAQARASESTTLGEEEKRQFTAFQQCVRSLVVVDESKPDDLDTSEAVALYSMIRSVSRFGRQGSACPPDPISVECANAVVSRYRQSRAQGLAHGGDADRWVFNNGRPFLQLIQIAMYGRSKENVEEDADIWLLLMEDLASLSNQLTSYMPHVDNTVTSLPHHFNSTMTDLSRHLVRHFGQDRSRELLGKVYPGDKVDELMAKATEVAGAQPRTSKLDVELPVTPPAMYSTLPVEEPQPEADADPSATAEPIEATGFNPEDDNPFLLPFNRNKKLIIMQSLNTLMHVHTYDQPGRGGKNSPILAAYQRLRENLKQNNHVASPMSLARLVDSLSMVPGSIDKCLEVYTLAQYVIRNCCRPEEQMRHWLSVENAMLQAHCRLGFLEQAGLNRAQIINAGNAPNADSYGTMINYAKDTTDDALVARELFDESRRLGVKPTLFLYNTVISKLGKARKAEWAIELFKHMKAAGFTPTSVTYGAVINACTRVGDGESAATLFAEMESSPNFKPRVPPFNTMMQYHLTTEPSRGKVLYYFNRMAQYRVLPTEHTYKLLLDAYVSLQPFDMESMDLIFTQLQNNPKLRVQGTHWASVISAHGLYQGNVDKALEIFNSIPSHPTSRVELKTEPVVWEAILHVMANKGTMAQLEAMRERMVEMGAQTTAYVNNVLITGYAKNGAIDRARELFEDMADGEVGVAAPNNHPELRTSSGNLKPSTRTPVPTSVVYREPSTFEAMLRAELLYGDEEAARVVLARMEDRRYPVNVFMKVRALYDDHVIRTAASSVSAASSPAELPQQTESAAIDPLIDADPSSSPTFLPRHEHEDHQADLYHAKKPSTARASPMDIPTVMTASPNAATYVSDLFGGHAVDESRVLSPN